MIRELTAQEAMTLIRKHFEDSTQPSPGEVWIIERPKEYHRFGDHTAWTVEIPYVRSVCAVWTIEDARTIAKAFV